MTNGSPTVALIKCRGKRVVAGSHHPHGASEHSSVDRKDAPCQALSAIERFPGGGSKELTGVEWAIASIAATLLFLVVGFASVLAARLYLVVRSVFLVGPLPVRDIVALGVIVVVAGVYPWAFLLVGLDPLGVLLFTGGSLIGLAFGRMAARREVKATPRIMQALASASLREVDLVSPGTVERSLAFARSAPGYLGAILDAILLVFNSPWLSLVLAKDYGIGGRLHAFRQFISKTPEEQREYIDRWASDPVLRFALEFLKVVLAFGIYDDDTVRRRIGYCGPLVPAGSPGGPEVFCPYNNRDAESRGVKGDARFRCWWGS